MKKYRVSVEYAAVETITYQLEVEDEAKLDFVIEDLIARGEHEAAIEVGRRIDVIPNTGAVQLVSIVDEPPKRPNLRIVN